MRSSKARLGVQPGWGKKAMACATSFAMAVTMAPTFSALSFADEATGAGAAIEAADQLNEANEGEGSSEEVIGGPWDIGKSTASDVTATLYADGSLRFAGTGDTLSYGVVDRIPWNAQMKRIKSIHFEEGVTPTDMNRWFYEATALEAVPALPDSVQTMRDTFYRCTSLKTVESLPASVTNLYQTFALCSSLVEAPDIPDTATSLYYTFWRCESLVKAGKMSSTATDTSYTFSNCTSLVEAPNIPGTSTRPTGMFEYCSSLVNPPVIEQGVKELNSTFQNCSSLKTMPDIPDSVTNMLNTFRYCSSLEAMKKIPSGVTNITECFRDCTSLVEVRAIPGSVGANARSVFFGCTSLTKAPKLNEGITGAREMFRGCTSLEQAPKLPSTLTSAYFMFKGCKSLAFLPKGFTLGGVQTMDEIFSLSEEDVADIEGGKLKTYASADSDSSITGFAWSDANRELVMLPEDVAVSDIAKLKAAIESANTLLETAVVSSDGKDVADDVAYMSIAAYDSVATAAKDAQSMLDSILESDVTSDEVATQAAKVEAAILVAQGTIKVAAVDSSSLVAAINVAQDKLDSVKVSEDGEGLDETDSWATPETVDAFSAVIAEAQEKLAAEGVSQNDVDDAVYALDAAKDTFDAYVHVGRTADEVAIEDLQAQIDELKKTNDQTAADLNKKIAELEESLAELKKKSAAGKSSSDTASESKAIPGKAKIKSASKKSKKMTVKWAKVKNATKYQVRYKAKGSSKWKTVTLGDVSKKTVKKLKKGTKYKVQLRAGSAGGWGKWSKAKTTKK